jgi:hypothetical protein
MNINRIRIAYLDAFRAANPSCQEIPRLIYDNGGFIFQYDDDLCERLGLKPTPVSPTQLVEMTKKLLWRAKCGYLTLGQYEMMNRPEGSA